MKKFTDVTARMVIAPVAVSLALAYEPLHLDEYVPHPDHTEERPSSEPDRLVGKVSVIIPTSSGDLWSGPFPCSWPPLPPRDRPSTPFTLA